MPAVVGVVVGMGLALVGAPVLGSLLNGVGGTTDPVTFVVVAVLLVVAAGAAVVPAWWAAWVDPVRVLRAD